MQDMQGRHPETIQSQGGNEMTTQPRDIEYGSNTHHIMLIIASAQNEPKTQETIGYVAFGKSSRAIRQGLDALERRGFLELTTSVRKQNREALRGQQRPPSMYAAVAYKLTESGILDLRERLAGQSPSRNQPAARADLGMAKITRKARS